MNPIMEATHVHLLLNHIPILGSVFGVLLLIVGMIIKNQSVEITGTATLLLACAMTLPVYFSGEEAEHTVESMAVVSEYELEEHEEHAELSLWIMMVAGVSALFSLIAYARAPHLISKTRIATAIIGGLGFITLIPLANHGGKIIHQELRDGDASSADGSKQEVIDKESDHDDD
jgi:hypothetical protein